MKSNQILKGEMTEFYILEAGCTDRMQIQFGTKPLSGIFLTVYSLSRFKRHVQIPVFTLTEHMENPRCAFYESNGLQKISFCLGHTKDSVTLIN